jgi:hypothetical protein
VDISVNAALGKYFGSLALQPEDAHAPIKAKNIDGPADSVKVLTRNKDCSGADAFQGHGYVAFNGNIECVVFAAFECDRWHKARLKKDSVSPIGGGGKQKVRI